MKRGAGALGLAILGAVFVPSWPIQLICYASVALTLLSYVYTRLTRHSLRVERDAPEVHAHPHTKVAVGLTVHSTSVLPLSFLGIQDRQGGLRPTEPPQTVVSLAHRGSARLTYTLKTMGRGIHELGPVTLMSSDPLGLFPWKITVDSRCHVTVLPEVGVIRTPIGAGSPGGEARARDPAFEDPSRFRAVREYVTGDPPPRIHWKTTARLGSLHTVEYEPALSCPCLVVLDLDLERYPLRSRYHFVERAIETAATLVLEAAQARQPTGLVSDGTLDPGSPQVPLGKGMGHALHILSLLARIAPVEQPERSAAAHFAAMTRPPAGTRVCFVGPPPTARILEQLRAVSAARQEVYRIDTGPESRVPIPGARVYTIHAYGEVLAGD